MNKAILINAGIAVAGVAVGYIAGTIVTRKQLENEYSTLANNAINEMRDHYRRLYKDGPYATPASAAETLLPDGFVLDTDVEDEPEEKSPVDEIFEVGSREELVNMLEQSGYTITDDGKAIPPKKAIDEAESINVFTDGKIYDSEGKGWDLQEELAEAKASRDKNHPYQIKTSEFHEEFDNFEKITLTYFIADETLCDENETIVEDANAIVGLDNLKKYMSEAEDKNFVYVRNEKFEADYEIILNEGAYAITVLGMGTDDEE